MGTIIDEHAAQLFTLLQHTTAAPALDTALTLTLPLLARWALQSQRQHQQQSATAAGAASPPPLLQQIVAWLLDQLQRMQAVPPATTAAGLLFMGAAHAGK